MKKEMNLTGKIYTLEILSGMLFYGIGILLITPPTSPESLKYYAIGLLSFIDLAILAKVAFSRSEKLDERAKLNLYKSSNLTIMVLTLFIFVMGVIVQIFLETITLNSAIVAFILASILIFHGASFRFLELSGR